MTIEFSEQNFRALEDGLGRIRAAAVRARISPAVRIRDEIKVIVDQANAMTNLLLNGEIADESEPEGT